MLPRKMLATIAQTLSSLFSFWSLLAFLSSSHLALHAKKAEGVARDEGMIHM